MEHGAKEIRQAVSLNVGDRYGFSTQDCEYRSLLTEVVSRQAFGNQEKVPVAIVQQIKPDKTFTKQTLLTNAGDIMNINRLPSDSRPRNAKRVEHIRFAANLVETALAAIKETGPVRAENWPPNLLKAAAVYCDQMGYDFYPKSVIEKLSPREKASYETAFDELKKTTEFDSTNMISPKR